MAKILLVEDNDSHRKMLREFLEIRKHEIIEAVDGAEGYQLYKQTNCDLVITDIYMPNKDGNDLIEMLKAEFPSVKIIAISGRGFMKGEHVLHVAEYLGAEHTVKKPLKITELLKVVDDLLAGS
jgi:YesN/AraC family two-component response regulator